VRSGAVPCKIAHDGISQGLSDIPGVFPSVAALCLAVQEEGASSLYRLARDFYLSKGSHATHLEEALKRV
jgi:hypothetical protein